MADDKAAIEAAVQTYFDGLYEGDADKLGSIFLDTSALTWREGDEVKVWPRADWLKAVRDRPSPKAHGLARDDEILLIDQSSPSTAFVKLRCQIPPRYFTDYLNFLKVDGRWQVAQKVFAVRMEVGR